MKPNRQPLVAGYQKYAICRFVFLETNATPHKRKMAFREPEDENETTENKKNTPAFRTRTAQKRIEDGTAGCKREVVKKKLHDVGPNRERRRGHVRPRDLHAGRADRCAHEGVSGEVEP